VHIGDSAHATSPQLGQGANMALLDALALAVALRESTGLAGAMDRFVARLVAGMTVAPLRGRAFEPLRVANTARGNL